MSASTRHPAFDLFNHWWVPGGIQTIVRREFDTNPLTVVNAELLAGFYESRDCKEAARLIEFIAQSPRLGRISSGPIAVSVILGLSPTEDAFASEELHVGSLDPYISPLQWLSYLARAFEEIPEPLRPVFDGYCGAIISVMFVPATCTKDHPLREHPRRSLEEITHDLNADACAASRTN